MLVSDVAVSRRDTTLDKARALGQLPLSFHPGRRSWVHSALYLRIAESRRDRGLVAEIVRQRHYAASWPCRPRTLILSYLADLGNGAAAGMVMVALLPGQYHVTRALALKQYEVLTLVRMWRADDLNPRIAPDFTPEMVRRVVKRVRADWCARKLRPNGLRAHPKLLATYADPAVGHDGAVYLGAGATDCGMAASGKRLFAWALDPSLRAPLRALGCAVADRARLHIDTG